MLIVKEELVDEAKRIFENTGITISSTGERHMGAWVGSQAHKEKYVSDKVDKWVALQMMSPKLCMHVTPLTL